VEIIIIMAEPEGFYSHFKKEETVKMILEDSGVFKPYNNVTKQVCKQNELILNVLKNGVQDDLSKTLQYLLQLKNPETMGLTLSFLNDELKRDPRVELIQDGTLILTAYMTQGL
jgi:hypothetical protein